MRSASSAARRRTDPDAPPSDLLDRLPARPGGRLKLADIKRAVDAVVKERIAAERAAKAAK